MEQTHTHTHRYMCLLVCMYVSMNSSTAICSLHRCRLPDVTIHQRQLATVVAIIMIQMPGKSRSGKLWKAQLKRIHFYDWPQIGRAPNGAEMTNNKRGKRPRQRACVCMGILRIPGNKQAKNTSNNNIEILWHDINVLLTADVTGQRSMENHSIHLATLDYILFYRR